MSFPQPAPDPSQSGSNAQNRVLTLQSRIDLIKTQASTFKSLVNESATSIQILPNHKALGEKETKALMKHTRWTRKKIEPTLQRLIQDKPLRRFYGPHADFSDDAFEEHSKKLVWALRGFVERWYAATDLEGDKAKVHHIWHLMTPTFVEYTLAVAESDDATGGWDSILQNSVQRKWLVAGILTCIYDKCIFQNPNRVLFGSNKGEEELLHKIDRNFFDSSKGDGFSRQKLRAKAVKDILGNAGITCDFFPEVEKLTERIRQVLLPLTRYLWNDYEPQGFYQQLFDLTSDFAYFQIAVRCCPDIITITSLYPGTPYDPREHYCLDLDIWQQSKSAIQEQQSVIREVIAGTTEVGSADPARVKDTPVSSVIIHYRPYTKICVFPIIKKYKAGSGMPGGDANGLRQYDINKGAALIYYGKFDRSLPPECLREKINKELERLQSNENVKHGLALALLRLFGWKTSTQRYAKKKHARRSLKPIGVQKSKGTGRSRQTIFGGRKARRDRKPQRPITTSLIPISLAMLAGVVYIARDGVTREHHDLAAGVFEVVKENIVPRVIAVPISLQEHWLEIRAFASEVVGRITL
ncbi:hypothetical protein BP6252_07028 [Coleophoma cylindrospora]|uniref:Uncharacterized protein n=1 Tax=Coleophoma cylindrospora TaxID=1849047 RepID=A0A3D8RGY5_9HELO|nr:hypothetical protein BP6252_07028 [Coleophoma cylindrospora]